MWLEWFLAFVAMPTIVLTIGAAAAYLHVHYSNRER